MGVFIYVRYKIYKVWKIHRSDKFLGPFLLKYFDPAIQEHPEYYTDNTREFDWYGVNLYSYSSMEKILADITKAIELLETDYDNPELAEIKEGFYWYPFTDKSRKELTDSEINELKKNCVPEAVDFYKRFMRRIRDIVRSSHG